MSPRWFCGLTLLMLCFLPARAEPAPSAREIVARIAAQDKILQQRRKEYDYDLEITREKLDDRDQAVSTSQEKMVVKGDKRPDFGTRTTLGQPEDEAK